MSKLSTAARRLLIGRPFRSDRLSHTLLPKRIALPVFASDAMSSVAYAPEEIFLMLSVAGLAAYSMAPWIALAVAAVLLVVVSSYRQNVHAYPSGGGDYEVVSTNLGPTAGLVVASALMVDYVLTVAVSIASAMSNIGSAIPFVYDHKVFFAVAAILLVTALNLRGVRESGLAFAIPTYAFIIGISAMLGWGLFRIYVLGNQVRAESAGFVMHAEHGKVVGIALVFLVARSFSSGCAALTGVEAISNGVPAFQKPKSRNAATTLLMLGAIAVALLMGVVALAVQTGAQVVDDPDTQLTGAPDGYQQKTLVAQLAQAVFGSFHLGFLMIAAVTALILVLAANTAFNGFPVLGSVLAQHSYLPRQLHTRGDRLAFSNGIIFLSAAAVGAVVAFRAELTALIQLYIVGVFISFTLSQIGMVRHWTRLLRTETDVAARRKMVRSRVVNSVGLVSTGAVLLIVLVTKFLAGAWIAIVAMGSVFILMKMIRRHYDTVNRELEEQAAAHDNEVVLPSRNHALVLVSKLHLPTLRALAYARATRPDVLEAITVSVDDVETRELVRQWEDSDVSVPLKVIASPYREITRPVLDYVKRVSKESPRTVVTVFIPEYVVGRWWEQLLHNQSAFRLKTRLLFMPGVMVTSVPWQLTSSERINTLEPHAAPGDMRRGIFD
ncbi:APC family permease [Mycobacterium marinum]|uniref:Conserved integral membrane alanine, valine and leucine rich protein n=1 Tax=Mycobacterium marinum (strain ATCC BAA-535 / M) TaxID=216594 RepID=B2HM10_MYCMM|nr:APC family permease [Mycobacterium marinum]ACC40474.1 conserved integral membrane alanine, valine and leucine rich protein [Mycobacterium marinum M]EPQ75787.1 putative integral membrane alanine and valine and leucine rich protein [Mycobacterium marinum MB2]MDC8970803.1 APC family permease [Mycobacterium marinum]MDC8980719.1 APC family permease [Mycobacterium marinum]MDC8992518.1 APC family permease [Mycobacterium marinum]